MPALAPPDPTAEPSSLRQARAADIPELLGLFRRSLDELQVRRGQQPLPLSMAAPELLMRHLISTDPEGAILAEAAGKVVGFAISRRRAGDWFLAFLFVEPAWQSRGLGSRLLHACLPPRGSRDRLATCVEAHQPVATSLYARLGMVPRVPLYLLTGRIAAGALPDLPEGFALSELEPGVATDLDLEIVGHAREQDHVHLVESGRSGWLMRDGGGRPIGYGYVQGSGRLGPVAARAAHDLPFLLGHLTRTALPAGAWQAIVPGPAQDALVPLLKAGMRIDGVPALYSATWAGPSFERYLPAGFGLL